MIEPITDKYDVPLMVARGFSSITFLHESAEKIPAGSVAYIYHLGDSDRYTKNSANTRLMMWSFTLPGFAVTDEQIEKWDLPTRFDKKTGEDTAVELDAIAPNELRKLVEKAILKHMPKKKYDALMVQEQRERQQIRAIIDQIQEELDP